MRGVWIEMEQLQAKITETPSLPMRGVWIEIHQRGGRTRRERVTPHAGSVD